MQIRNIGVILVIIGVIMMVYTGFNYVTTENVVDIGTLHIDKKENHPIQWSPIVGAVLFVAGLLMLFVGKKNV